VHFFDMLIWIFGNVKKNVLYQKEERTASGILSLERANVKWFLSVDKKYLPIDIDKSTYRSVKIEGKEIEFSKGFEDLHTISYQKILNGESFRLKDVKPSIELISNIRKQIL